MPTVKTANQLGSVLRATRTALNVRLEDLAGVVGTTTPSLRRLESGNATSALRTLFALLDELGIEMHLEVPPHVGDVALSPPSSKPKRTRVRP